MILGIWMFSKKSFPYDNNNKMQAHIIVVVVSTGEERVASAREDENQAQWSLLPKICVLRK